MRERGASPRGGMSPFLFGGVPYTIMTPHNFPKCLDGRRRNLGVYMRNMKLLIGLKNTGFLG
jgi:hypothetical protein